MRNSVRTRILIAYPIVIIAAVLFGTNIINILGYFIICILVVIGYIMAILREDDVNVLEDEE